MGVSNACQQWLSAMVVSNGCQQCLSAMAVSNGCSCCCFVFPPKMAFLEDSGPNGRHHANQHEKTIRMVKFPAQTELLSGISGPRRPRPPASPAPGVPGPRRGRRGPENPPHPVLACYRGANTLHRIPPHFILCMNSVVCRLLQRVLHPPKSPHWHRVSRRGVHNFDFFRDFLRIFSHAKKRMHFRRLFFENSSIFPPPGDPKIEKNR